MESHLYILHSVEQYDINTAVLLLFHNFPHADRPTTSRSRSRVRTNPNHVLVNVEPLLETVDKGVFEVGAWVNVLGYIMPSTPQPGKAKNAKPGPPRIQATFIWSAGILDIEEYEKVLVERQRNDAQTHSS